MITYPDYIQWALSLETPGDIAEALAKAFNQGYHLGLNKGWAIEQDRDTLCSVEQQDKDVQTKTKLPLKPLC